MKTILHIIDTTGPGGAETVFIDLASGLSKDKFRSVVVIRGQGWVYDELCRRGLVPIILDAKGSFNWRYLSGLRSLIRREQVDLVQSHLLGANVYCSLAGLTTRTPVIATFHGAVDIGENERLKGLKFAAINLGAQRVIAVSGGLRDDIISRTSLNPGKIEVVFNGIHTSEFQRPRSDSLRRKYGWSEHDFIIGSLGNIRPAKGYNILLEAAVLLKKRGQPYRFVIAGQPDKNGLYETLLEQRKVLGLEEQVQFLGFLDDPVEFLANLDLFLSSSISEGLPLSAIQAMAARLPILATRCGGYEELVADRENGWLADVGDPVAIADAVALLRTKPEIRDKLAEKARKHVVETFDISVMFSDYERIYNRLISN